jgi:hypothetical protein
MGHQDGAGEARGCTQKGGDPIQFGISEFDFEPNPKSKTNSSSN